MEYKYILSIPKPLLNDFVNNIYNIIQEKG